MTADQPMTAEQAATLKRLAEAAYELEAFQPNLTRAEADLRISMLTAKLKLLDDRIHSEAHRITFKSGRRSAAKYGRSRPIYRQAGAFVIQRRFCDCAS